MGMEEPLSPDKELKFVGGGSRNSEKTKPIK